MTGPRSGDRRTGPVLAAADKFKGSLSAAEVSAMIAAGIRAAQPEAQVITVPVADGGEGTLAAALASGFSPHPVTVTGPTGVPVVTGIGVRASTAVVELASASGSALLPDGAPAPLTATSRGTGELIRAALDAGCRDIILGVGGSAGMDGGAGLLQALGARLLDAGGADIAPGGIGLAELARLDLSGLDPRIARTRITLASDVDNPLLGPRGAVGMYGEQKGADRESRSRLESALAHWAAFLPPGRAEQPGAGAAGGVGFAGLAALGARFRYGAEVVLELVGFADRLDGARLVITGEGRIDRQTGHGKAPAVVAAAASAAGVPVVAVCGRSTLTEVQTRALGLAGSYPLSDLEPDEDTSIARAAELVHRQAEAIARDWLAEGE